MRAAYWYPPGEDLATGTPVVLDDGKPSPMFVRPGAGGLEVPEWTIRAVASPGIPGAMFNGASMGVRAVTLPIYLTAPDRASLRAAWGDLVATLDPEDGPGKLVIGNMLGGSSGGMRWLSAVYAGGLEGDESAMSLGDREPWWQFNLQFRALDPFWYSMEDIAASWLPQVGTPRFPMVFPYTFTRPALVPEVELDVSGNAKCWPTWTMTGPFTRMRLTNDRSGEWVQVTRALPDAGATAVLTTKPGERALRTPAGVNIYRQLSGVPFPLRAGDTVSVAAVGALAGGMRLDMTAREAWRTAP